MYIAYLYFLIKINILFCKIQNIEEYKKNYELCKKYMFHANRQMRCSHPNCPPKGCVTTFTPDVNHSIEEVSIPCEIIEGYNSEDVFWDEDEKVGDRRSTLTTDNKWFVDVVKNPKCIQKKDPLQPAFKFKAITERQCRRKVRNEIQTMKMEEKRQINNGASCSFVSLRESVGGSRIVKGKIVNQLMPRQVNMQQIVNANVLAMNKKNSEPRTSSLQYPTSIPYVNVNKHPYATHNIIRTPCEYTIQNYDANLSSGNFINNRVSSQIRNSVKRSDGKSRRVDNVNSQISKTSSRFTKNM